MPIQNTLQTLWNQWTSSVSGHRRRPAPRGQHSTDLEARQLLAGLIAPAPAVPSFNGMGNNLAHPNWGSAGSDLLRQVKAAYSDGISTPAGANRPSARAISSAVATQTGESESEAGLSNFVYAWGQFIDHDMSLTTSATPKESFPIAVPKGDPLFDPANTGTQTISLSRSKWDPATGKSTTNPRQQVNDITSYLDGSMVYGSSQATADSLRTFQGGKLKTSEGNLLPSENTMFVAGDIRVNENPELTSIHVIFLREHNRIACEVAKSNPALSDEQIFQQARLKVIAEIQAITYNEFLPALLGPNAIRPYTGYKPHVNVGIANEFSTAGFRVGHTMVGDDIQFLDDQGNEIRDPVLLKDAFFNPALVRETGVDPILKYLASDRADEIDTQIVGSLQNFLFGAPGQGGFDLAALNIQRGRDHGLADYNTTREAYGLPKVTSFAQITSDPALQQQLRTLYGDVNKIDLWVGGLAEDHTPGGNVGPTFTRIIADQFTRLRDGDRFYYENVFQGPQLTELRNTKLSDVLKRNTGLKNLQPNVFIFRTSIEGRVFGDRNRDGQWNGPEMGLGLRIVELVDAEGAVVATAQTRSDGSFRFEGMPLGSYQVREVLPPGTVSTTPPKPIVINKGMKVVGINVGEAPAACPAAPPASRPASAAPTDSKVVASSSSSLTINGSLLNDSLLNS